jgi:hypothetical protein
LPIQCVVYTSPLKISSTVIYSSPVQSPTVRKNVQMTYSLASWSSIAVATSIWLYEVHPPLECTSSLAVIQVHSWGIPGGLPGPQSPHLLALGLQNNMLNALQVDICSYVHSESTMAATIGTNQVMW